MKNLTTVIRTTKSLWLIWSMIGLMILMTLIQDRPTEDMGLALTLFPAFGLGWTMVEVRCYSLLHRKNH